MFNHFILFFLCVCIYFQLWCAAGVDLTGWRVSSQESVPAKTASGSSDPLHAEEDGADKKSSHSSPEKRKVDQQPTPNVNYT